MSGWESGDGAFESTGGRFLFLLHETECEIKPCHHGCYKAIANDL